MIKSVLKETFIKSTEDIRHILANLLVSYKKYLDIMDYHGNINPKTIIAVPVPRDEDPNSKKNYENTKVKIKDFKYKLIFMHKDFQSKEDWVTNKIMGLNTHKK